MGRSGTEEAVGSPEDGGWAERLHALWLAADLMHDVTGLADRVYDMLLSRPGVLSVVGARWSGRQMTYIRLASAEEPTPFTWRPPFSAWSEPVVRPGTAVALDDGAPVVLEHEGPAAAAALWPGGLVPAGSPVAALECAFPLAGDDWATLWVGLDRPPGKRDPLRGQLVQVAEVLATSNVRLLAHHAHERRQVEDAFLAEASLQMDMSLDVEETLRRIARLAVPAVAEGCLVHLFDTAGVLRPVASAHVAAFAQGWLRDLARNDDWLVKLLRESSERRESTLVGTEDLLDGPFGAVPGVGAVQSLSVTPLRARGRSLGTLTFLHHQADAPVATPRLLGDLASRAALAIDTSTLYEKRRNHVEVLQRHLLPRTLPEVSGLGLSSAYQVGDSTLDVGGDFYDALAIGDGVALLIGDVCGRGAEAAAVTGLARHTLRTLLLEGTSPGLALTRLNDTLIAEGAERFVTALIALLTPAPHGGWDVELAGAGHPRPLVRRADGSVEEVNAAGLLLGVIPGAGYRSVHALLEPGASLVMFTDGLTEARGADGTFFEQGLPAAVTRCVDGRPDPAGRLVAAAAAFRHSGDDDTALLIATAEERRP
ncbi:PP2C family protein-serine/threonine phosphatase [Streptomyces sp. NPDC059491]|uniref:PP2C family protein-serine/threonine phosphatase n=1 Tax=Streptomyces sp. NPDC059491 TaxID=3346850 RepID=UPI0036763ACD